MTQQEINRAVSQATGETVAEIRHRGFDIADPPIVAHDPEPGDILDKFLDWDDVELQWASLMPY